MRRRVLGNVQILRFVAAGAVLLEHTLDVLLQGRSPIAAVPLSGGLDLFFVISGFIMAWLTWGRFGERGLPRLFLLRRAIRIAPPYWFFTTLMVAATLFAMGQVRKTVLGMAQVITSYAFIPWPRLSDGKLNPLLSQGWTLNYEAFFYVAFAAALFFRRGLFGLVCAFLLLATLNPLIPPQLFVLRFYTDPLILEFLAGIGLASLYRRGVRLSPAHALAYALLAVLLYVAWVLSGLPAARAFVVGAPATLLAASLVLARDSDGGGPVRRFLRAGGDASYTLYLSHTFVVNAVAVAWHRIAPGHPWAGVAIALFAALAVALLFYRVAERPFTDTLHRRFGLRAPGDAQNVAP